MAKDATEETIDFESIPDVEVGKGVDLSEFVGAKKKIEKISILNVETPYDETGKYNEAVKRKIKVLKIETEAITTVKNKDGQEVPVRASELFNMKQNDEGEWGISTAEKSKIRIFMKRQKVNSLKALIGTSVIVKDYTDKKTGNTYLGFVVQ